MSPALTCCFKGQLNRPPFLPIWAFMISNLFNRSSDIHALWNRSKNPPKGQPCAVLCGETNKLSLACHESSQNSLEHITNIEVEINLAPVSSTHTMAKNVWLISKEGFSSICWHCLIKWLCLFLCFLPSKYHVQKWLRPRKISLTMRVDKLVLCGLWP